MSALFAIGKKQCCLFVHGNVEGLVFYTELAIVFALLLAFVSDAHLTAILYLYCYINDMFTLTTQ